MTESAAKPDNWAVYLILCANRSLYCGISNRPALRFRAHCAGKGAKYTRIAKPLEMRLLSDGLSKPEALRQERAFKKLPAARKRLLWADLAEFLHHEAV